MEFRWYSFIGFSDKNVVGGIKYFEKENIYELLFNSNPNDSFWDYYFKSIFIPELDFFDSSIPGPYQYLMSFGVSRFIKSKQLSNSKNRLDAIKRGIKNKELKGDEETGKLMSSDEEIGTYLVGLKLLVQQDY